MAHIVDNRPHLRVLLRSVAARQHAILCKFGPWHLGRQVPHRHLFRVCCGYDNGAQIAVVRKVPENCNILYYFSFQIKYLNSKISLFIKKYLSIYFRTVSGRVTHRNSATFYAKVAHFSSLTHSLFSWILME